MQESIEMTADNRKEMEEAVSVETDDADYQALMDAVAADYEAWEEKNTDTLLDSENSPHTYRSLYNGRYRN